MNGGYIGVNREPDECSAEGVWELSDVHSARLANKWPTLNTQCGDTPSSSSSAIISSSSGCHFIECGGSLMNADCGLNPNGNYVVDCEQCECVEVSSSGTFSSSSSSSSAPAPSSSLVLVSSSSISTPSSSNSSAGAANVYLIAACAGVVEAAAFGGTIIGVEWPHRPIRIDTDLAYESNSDLTPYQYLIEYQILGQNTWEFNYLDDGGFWEVFANNVQIGVATGQVDTPSHLIGGIFPGNAPITFKFRITLLQQTGQIPPFPRGNPDTQYLQLNSVETNYITVAPVEADQSPMYAVTTRPINDAGVPAPLTCLSSNSSVLPPSSSSATISSSSSSISSGAPSSSSAGPAFACVELITSSSSSAEQFLCVRAKSSSSSSAEQFLCVRAKSSSSSSSSSSECATCELEIQFRTYTIPDNLLIRTADDEIIFETGAVATGNDFMTINVTNLPCGFYFCVDAPVQSTVWDLITTGCVEINTTGGQNVNGIPSCFDGRRSI
jgi:hypothetical protein